MSAVVSFLRPATGGAGVQAAWKIRKKEVLAVGSATTATAEAGEIAVVLNTETEAILVAFGSTPDAQAATETSATSAGIGVPTGLTSPALGPLNAGDKISAKVVA
jgi:hypothetical protein